MDNVIEKRLKLEREFKSGIYWFYWIAGLSIINSLAIYIKDDISYVVGLGVTQIVNVVTYELSYLLNKDMILQIVGINLTVALIYLFIGKLSIRKSRYVIISGIIIYTLDTLILIYFKDYLSMIFHLFVLTRIFVSYKNCMKLISLSEETTPDSIYKEKS